MTENAAIRKCREEEISQIGQFYDSVIHWLDDHVNYPQWIYGVYPSERSVRTMAESGSQYVCFRGDTIIGAFALNDEPQGSYQRGQWSQELRDGECSAFSSLLWLDSVIAGK